ncbi:MAG TPA: hypothetical protein VGO31_02750 [Microbacteriaceae bacterium]|nr:hypothetical protein [Microbacteriaceae bacterium]
MVVGLILTTLISSQIVSGYGFSSSIRASVQSQATADAGVAAARASLYVSGGCTSQPTTGKYVSTGTVKYSAIVEHDDGSGWQAGCPTLNTTRVRITSTGTAQSSGVAGVSSGNTSKVEAVFNYLTPGVTASGTSMFLNSGGQVEANSSFDLSESDGLVVKNGNFVCSKNNAVINGDVTIVGNLTFTSSCTVNGNATVSGTATLGSGLIRGKLTASAASPTNPNLTGQAHPYVQSTVTPATPPWTDVTYRPQDWVDSSGAAYEIKTAPTNFSCTLPNGSLGGSSLGHPVIINMLGCAGGPIASNNTTVQLTSDVVIFAQQFNFSSVNSLVFASQNSSIHRIWFITPDSVPGNNLPDCNRSAPSPDTQGDFVAKNGLTASDVFQTTNTVQAMLYTPCAFLGKNGFTWNGQIYAGGYSYVQNNPVFTFTPIGIAGVNLDTGLTTTVVTSAQPGTQISNRDLSGG